MPDFGKYVSRLPVSTPPELARALADVFRDIELDSGSARSKLSKFVFASDFDASTAGLAQATTVAADTTLMFPDSQYLGSLPSTYTPLLEYFAPDTPINVYQESGETTRFAKRVFRGQLPGAHTGDEYSIVHIEGRPAGSGGNGPTNADYGLTISLAKQAFDTTSVVGEIDGMNIVVRNGGTGSDCTAWLANVAHYGTGFCAVFEAQSTIINTVVTHQIQVQAGVCDNVNGSYVGFFTNANTGSLGAAYQANSTSPSTWSYLFRGYKNSQEKINIDGDGIINMFDSSNNKKTLRCVSNNFSIVDNAGTTEILSLSNAGAMSIASTYSGAGLIVSGNQVVTARQTGWSAATGTPTRTSFATSTVTLPQLAERVKALIDDLITHGLIGT